MLFLKWLPAAALPPLLLAALPAAAAAQSPFHLSANAGLVSDYRFRGISLSNRNPALQGGIDVETDFGLFAGTWASSIAEYGGAHVELDAYGGYKGSVAGTRVAVTAYAYFYPGAGGLNYVEFQATGERDLGPVTLGVEASFSPRQANVVTANTYFGVSAAMEIPGTGVTATVRGGHEDGFFDDKWDWELRAAYTLGPVTGSIAYVDSDYGGAQQAGRLGRGGVVASLLAEF